MENLGSEVGGVDRDVGLCGVPGLGLHLGSVPRGGICLKLTKLTSRKESWRSVPFHR